LKYEFKFKIYYLLINLSSDRIERLLNESRANIFFNIKVNS